MDYRVIAGIALLIIGIGFTLGSYELSVNHVGTVGSPKGGYYPLTMEDGLGQTVTISSYPSRIVSVAPSDTQILVSLGLGSKIIGADFYSAQLLQELNESSLIPNAHVITGVYPLNVTGIVVLKPSIVVADAGLEGSYYNEMRNANLSVFYTHGDLDVNFHEIENDVMMTATVFDRVNQGDQVVSWMNHKVEEFSSNEEIGSVAYVLWICPDFSFYTVGGNTFISNVMSHAGGMNVFSSQSGYPLDHISQLIESDPDVLIFTEMYNVSYTEGMIHEMEQEYPALHNVTAFKDDRIYILDQGLPVSIMNEPAPLSVYGIEIVHEIMDGEAPHVINQTWIQDDLNVSLPVF